MNPIQRLDHAPYPPPLPLSGLSSRAALLFACDCLERATMAPAWRQAEMPTLPVWAAIEVTRRFADGHATADDVAAAWAAVNDAGCGFRFDLCQPSGHIAFDAAIYASMWVVPAWEERQWQAQRFERYRAETETGGDS